jgi:hypothetical protein
MNKFRQRNISIMDKPDAITGLDAKDINPEDQGRRGRRERLIRNSAASNRLHVRLTSREPGIVEGHFLIRDVRIRAPERFLLESATGALELPCKGVHHLPIATHGQMHMGKLSPAGKADQAERTTPRNLFTNPHPKLPWRR